MKSLKTLHSHPEEPQVPRGPQQGLIGGCHPCSLVGRQVGQQRGLRAGLWRAGLGLVQGHQAQGLSSLRAERG